jgi:hypothetical protein
MGGELGIVAFSVNRPGRYPNSQRDGSGFTKYPKRIAIIAR